jgi:dynein heavy chain, axonemal
MPCEHIPVSILQLSLKITYEPSKGLKANILNSLLQLPRHEDCDYSDNIERFNQLKQLTYSLCFFHAVVQERRKFGPLGWNVRYEFNESDLQTASTVLTEMLSDEYTGCGAFVLWESIRKMIGDIVYGGRVTDEADRRILKIILKAFINEHVLDHTYKYSESDAYRPPRARYMELKFNDMLSLVEQLPEIDCPEIFGMNESANVTFQMSESASLLETLLVVQP